MSVRIWATKTQGALLIFISMVRVGRLSSRKSSRARIVASQALISGAFSLTWQGIGLGLFPRLDVLHTHRAHAGQIYIPIINWGLYLGCVALVLGFGSSSALAAAYGLAVAGVMLITSLAMFEIARRYWRWGAAGTALVWGPLTAVNAAPFSSRVRRSSWKVGSCHFQSASRLSSPWRPGAGGARRPLGPMPHARP